MTEQERMIARKQGRDVARYERLGIRAGSQVGFRMMQASIKAMRRGDPSFVQVAKEQLREVQPFLADAITISFLLGHTRSLENATLRLSQTSDAVEVLRKRLEIDPERIKDLMKVTDAQALTVLKDVEASVERRLQKVVLKSVAEGYHISEGVSALRVAFKACGITPRNSFTLENLFRTQMQLGYSAGRWQADQDPVIQEILWGYKYVTVGDDRVRPEHEKLEGMTAPKDDPIWNTMWPPNGWSCRCQVISLFPEEAPRTKYPERPDPDEEDPVIPGPDKGFDFNPGIMFPRMGRVRLK